MITPTLHHPVELETRVRFPKNWSSGDPEKPGHHYGTVIGVSFVHIVFHYIVLLDEPIDTPEGKVRGVTLPGPLLESEDGSKHWRLTE